MSCLYGNGDGDDHSILLIQLKVSRTNVLLQLTDCPATALQYPVYHPNRSNFYNFAMMLPEIYIAFTKKSYKFVNVVRKSS